MSAAAGSRRPARAASSCGAGLVAALLLACITSYQELPLCAALSPRDPPPDSCADSAAVVDYEDRLTFEILRHSLWEYPAGVPLHVALRSDRRVGLVCVGSESARPGWSARDRVAASLGALRSLPPGPACLAGTTLDLTGELTRRSIPAGAIRLPVGTRSCREFQGVRCVPQPVEVCAVFQDGRRRTYPNACEACREPSVVGYLDFECRIH